MYGFLFEWPLARILAFLPVPLSVLGPPKGLIQDIKGYIDRWEKGELWTERGIGHWYLPLRDPELVFFDGQAPNVAGFSGRLIHRFPELFLVHIRQGKLALRDGVVLSPDDRVFDRLMHNWGTSMRKHRIFRSARLPPLQKRDGIFASILTPGGRVNYYHWVIDSIPRIALLEKAGVHSFQLVVPSTMQPWHWDSLALLGYDRSRCVEFGEEFWQMESLLVPSFVQDSGFSAPWSVDWLRERLLPQPVLAPNRRIYICRSKSKRRQLLNEAEILAFLESEGFTAMYPEDLSLRDQIKLCSEAELIVAPHGAGLTNLLYAPKGCRVIELMSPQYVNPCFFSLGLTLSVKYSCLVGECPTPASGRLELDYARDYSVPLREIQQALR